MKKGDYCTSAASNGIGGLSGALRAGHSIVSLVSGLSSSKVSACNLMIKEFCGGKGMIEQPVLKQISNPAS